VQVSKHHRCWSSVLWLMPYGLVGT
jgi:hypothetical protein